MGAANRWATRGAIQATVARLAKGSSMLTGKGSIDGSEFPEAVIAEFAVGKSLSPLAPSARGPPWGGRRHRRAGRAERRHRASAAARASGKGSRPEGSNDHLPSLNAHGRFFSHS
jgi:hypothetical protein